MADDEKIAEGTGGAEGASEDELRAQLEEEIRKVRVEDVLLQSVVSILNLAARRVAKDDERDLGQAKLGIDAATALVDLVPADAQPQLRQAISELQLLYAKHAEGGAGEEAAAGEAPPEGAEGTAGVGGSSAATGPGGGKRDSGLWTPPGS